MAVLIAMMLLGVGFAGLGLAASRWGVDSRTATADGRPYSILGPR